MSRLRTRRDARRLARTADEFIPITEDCRRPQRRMLTFSYTFRKGFVANTNRGGRCVNGKHASNGKLECRLETLDDTVLVMDVTNHSHFDACGAEIPRWIRMRLQAFGDDTASIKSFGLDVVADLCDRLRAGGVPGLHFYTMNQSAATTELVRRLALG